MGRLSRRSTILFLLFLLSLAFFIPSFSQDEAEASNSGSIVKLGVEPSISEFNFSISSMQRYIPPNRTDEVEVYLTAIRGNVNTLVNLTLEGDITSFCRLSFDSVILAPMSQNFTLFMIEPGNASLGIYTGNLTGVVNGTGFNRTISITVEVTEQAGRFMIRVVDQANNSLSRPYIELYKSLLFLESGRGSTQGMYTTHYYKQDEYYIIFADATYYDPKATGIRLEEMDQFITIVLGGDASLVFEPSAVSKSLISGQTTSVVLRLKNVGRGRDFWIDIEPDVGWLHFATTYVDELLPGGYVDIPVTIGPLTYGGYYIGHITADGIRDKATATFYITNYVIVYGGGGGGGGGGGPSYTIVIQNETPSFQVPPTEYLFPSAILEYPMSVELVKNKLKTIFVKVSNDGDVQLTGASININGTIFSEVHPKSYYYIDVNSSRYFMVNLLSEQAGSGSLLLTFNSKEFQISRTIRYSTSIGELDSDALLDEIGSFRELLENLDRALTDLGTQGYPVSGAFSLVSIINREINNAEDDINENDYAGARTWMDSVIRDIDDLVRVINNLSAMKPPGRRFSWLCPLTLIFLMLGIAYTVEKQEDKRLRLAYIPFIFVIFLAYFAFSMPWLCRTLAIALACLLAFVIWRGKKK